MPGISGCDERLLIGGTDCQDPLAEVAGPLEVDAAAATRELRVANSGGTPAATRRVGTSWANRSPKIVPAIVSPIVPPICWKKVTLLVAAPICCGATAFWTTSVKTASDGPMPSPASTIQSQRTGRSVSARRFVIRNRRNREQRQRADHHQLVAMGPGDDLAGGRRRATIIPTTSGRRL